MIRAVHVSIERGINFIDVSPFYGLTRAETLFGKALKSSPARSVRPGDEGRPVRHGVIRFRFLRPARNRKRG